MVRLLGRSDAVELLPIHLPRCVAAADALRRGVRLPIICPSLCENIDFPGKELSQGLMVIHRSADRLDAEFDLALLLVVVGMTLAIAQVSAALGEMIEGASQLKRLARSFGGCTAEQVGELLVRQVDRIGRGRSRIVRSPLRRQVAVETIQHFLALQGCVPVRGRKQAQPLQKPKQLPLAVLPSPLLPPRLALFAPDRAAGAVLALLDIAFHAGRKDAHAGVNQINRPLRFSLSLQLHNGPTEGGDSKIKTEDVLACRGHRRSECVDVQTQSCWRILVAQMSRSRSRLNVRCASVVSRSCRYF